MSKPGILFFSDSRESLPVAWKLARENIWVEYYIHDRGYRDNFDGMLPKISMSELPAALKRCDTVVFDLNLVNHKKPHDIALLTKFGCSANSPDVFGPISDKLRKTHKVIGGGQEMARIEFDRKAGMDLAKKLGFDIPNHKIFKSLKEGAKFLEANKNKLWYLKPFDNAGLDLTCCDTFPGELADMMLTTLPVRFKKDNIEFMLQEKVDGVEVSSELWSRGDGSQLINPNRTLELKKMMDGNLGVATGSQSNIVWRSPDASGVIFDFMQKPLFRDMCKYYTGPTDANCIITEDGKINFLEWTCYDAETEVLTKDGWKYFPKVMEEDEICTLNPNTDTIEYQKISGYIEKQYQGDMVKIKSENGAHYNLDILVTPDHNMYFKKYKKNKELEKFELIPADKLPSHGGVVKRIAKWKGIDRQTFVLPEYIEYHVNNRHNITYPIKHEAIDMDMKTWLRFFGLYIAEGSMNHKHKQRAQLNITQSPHNHYKTDDIMYAMPFNVHKYGNKYQIGSIQLTTYMDSHKLGKCYEKYIPTEFKELDVEYLQALWEGLVAGDGSVHKRTGQISYSTTSKQLADDIQEIIMKLGMVSNIRKVPTKGTEVNIRGKSYIRNHDQYILSIRTKDGSISMKPELVHYDGKVYCVEVPNGIVYVRRNGRPWFCGNCRFGYSALYLFLTFIPDGQLSNFFLNDFNAVFQDGFVASQLVSVAPYPFWNKSELDKMVKDNVINHKPWQVPGAWWQDVKLHEDGSFRCCGSDGMICVMTNRGDTLDDAIDGLYRKLDKKRLRISGNVQYRTKEDMQGLVKRYNTLKKWGIT